MPQDRNVGDELAELLFDDCGTQPRLIATMTVAPPRGGLERGLAAPAGAAADVLHPLDRHVLDGKDPPLEPRDRARAAWRTRWSRSATFVARWAASEYAEAAAGRSPPSS